MAAQERCVELFWRKVRKTCNCWVWMGARTNKNYGHMNHNGAHVYAHRFSWELHKGAIPAGLVVCHKCDNRRCVKPDHLFLGTHQENNADMWAKGRGVGGKIKGTQHPHAKLTDDKVKIILAKYKEGATQLSIAYEFGVCQTNISRIVRGKGWPHVDMKFRHVVT
jgi:hypothetical protein